MSKDKILNAEQAKKIIAENKTVFVSGSFDVLHLGHLHFLFQAKKLVGDSGNLVVAVLSDAEIKKRKGDGRPIFTQEERIEALSYLYFVDYLLKWDKEWEQLRNFVLEAKPEILAVVEGDPGIENKRAHIQKINGSLKVISRETNHSSSKVIERIKSL